jgi:hypothetical protein
MKWLAGRGGDSQRKEGARRGGYGVDRRGGGRQEGRRWTVEEGQPGGEEITRSRRG